mmetsp:Transcript_10817/g.17227  ORF Transcript_10817/g.17227 Transcript_10817/m.17227 type:complete len:365 (+) Transcript_10817:45-1139(+)
MTRQDGRSDHRQGSSDVLVAELLRLCEVGHLATAVHDSNLSLQVLRHLEDALFGLSGQEACLAPRAGLVVEELLPANLALRGFSFQLVGPLLLLDCLNFAALCVDHLLCVCFRNGQTLRDLVTRGSNNLLDLALLLGNLPRALQTDLVELHLCPAAIVGEGDLVALLSLFCDDALIPKTIFREDCLAARSRLALGWVGRPQHPHVGDLELPSVGEADEFYLASLLASLVAAHRLDVAVVPLLLEEGLACAADERCVHRFCGGTASARRAGTCARPTFLLLFLLLLSGGCGLVFDQILSEDDDFRKIILQLHEGRLIGLLLEGFLDLGKLLTVCVELRKKLLGRLREIRHVSVKAVPGKPRCSST